VRAIVLAAGRGSRLGALGNDRPKCLTSLAGETLLAWQRHALRAAGIEDVLVVRGYRADLLPGDGYTVVDNPRWANTNMVGSLCQAATALRAGPCLVAYADIVYHPDVIGALRDAPGDLAITFDRRWESLWRERFGDPLVDAETFALQGAWLAAIGGRPQRLEDVQGQYMGLLRFTPRGWSELEAILEAQPPTRRDQLDMTSLLALHLAAGGAIRAVGVDGRWCEVDSADDLRLYEERVRQVDAGLGAWSHDWRW
jgi:choline kinase